MEGLGDWENGSDQVVRGLQLLQNGHTLPRSGDWVVMLVVVCIVCVVVCVCGTFLMVGLVVDSCVCYWYCYVVCFMDVIGREIRSKQL